jgi:hypothetical protein
VKNNAVMFKLGKIDSDKYARWCCLAKLYKGNNWLITIWFEAVEVIKTCKKHILVKLTTIKMLN